jgi:hypothetical protein
VEPERIAAPAPTKPITAALAAKKLRNGVILLPRIAWGGSRRGRRYG